MRTSFPLSSSLSLSPTGLCALLMLAALGLAAVPTQAQTPTTINFDNFTAQAQAGGGAYVVGPSYSTQGFTFTTGNKFIAYSGDSRFGDGETSLFADGGRLTTLTQNNGQTFSFNAIDLGPFNGNSQGTQFAGPVTFTGTFANGTTVTDTKTITSTRFQTFNFTGFTGLTSLTFAPISGFPQFDNVVVNSPVAPVPEASTTLSLGLLLALGGLAVVARKKKSNASA